MRAIHCIGDSHTSFFSGHDQVQPVWPGLSNDKYPFLRTFHVGPLLAYNLGRSGTTTGGREKVWEVLKQAVPPGGRVLFCLGEIDCRAHLLKQAWKQGKSLKEVAEDCVKRYTEALEEVRAAGFELIVYNAIGSRRKTTRRSKWDNDQDFPAVGSCRERNEISGYFNASLKKWAEERGVIFLEIFPSLVNAWGVTDSWYFMDKIHLSQRAMPLLWPQLRAALPEIELPELKEEPRSWISLLRRKWSWK